MKRFEIQPVLSSALPDVADFLHRWRCNEGADSSAPQQVRETPLSIERRLKWLLLENPVTMEGSQLGYCVRDPLGVIRGLILTFPAAFLCGDQRLLGLCSGSFFVEPAARSLGFYLFRKYLASQGCSFFFATTCNAQSGALWKNLRGCAIPNSEMEYVLPLRLDRVIPAFIAERTSSGVASGIARICGLAANPILRLLARHSSELTIVPCEDWEKLSELSRRHRSVNCATSDRTPEFLRWRYGPTSPLYPCGVYLFRDKQGSEGWFSLAKMLRAGKGQIRGSVLLDAVWPRAEMSFRSIFQQIICVARTDAEALFFRSQTGLDDRDYSRWAIPRKFTAPRTFVIAPENAPLLTSCSLDYDNIDEGAWSFQWADARGSHDLSPLSSGAALNHAGSGAERKMDLDDSRCMGNP
jgi:hypothetical protein